MGKKPFTTRIDEEVLALAQRLADTERRSVTSLIEVAVLDYAARRGTMPSPKDQGPPHEGAGRGKSTTSRAARGGPRSR